MKALFYGGAISALAGMALGMGMIVPADAPATPQPEAQQVADYVPASETYDTPPSDYPSSYVLNAAYAGDPVVEVSPETLSYDEPAADAVLKASWQPPDQASAATPQDVAAAGDTTPAPEAPKAAPDVRAYTSIDALLNQQQAAQAQSSGPSI